MNNINPTNENENEITGMKEESTAAGIAEKKQGDINAASGNASVGGKPKKGLLKKLCLPWYISALAIVFAVLITFMSTYTAMFVKYTAVIDSAVADNSSSLLYDADVIDAIKQIYEGYYIETMGEFDADTYMYYNMYGIENFGKKEITDMLASFYVAWTGDRYGVYYAPESVDELETSLNGETVGIGVYVSYDETEGTIEVLYTMEDSPAKKAGLLAGDLIIGVNDTDIRKLTYEEATGMIIGDEGTEVDIKVLRQGQEKTFSVKREKVVSETVFSRMSADGKTGIIRITEFTVETPAQFKSAVQALEASGADSFVFDMRDNPGGTLDGVLGVLSYILPKDTPLIKEVDKYENEKLRYSDDEHTMDCPMTVLVNGNTASAAELFTINMRDYDKAEIIGVNTFGKGIMQTFFNLPNGGMLKMTYKWYSSAISDNYNKTGIAPDVVEEPNESVKQTNIFKLADTDDNQLQKALEVIATLKSAI